MPTKYNKVEANDFLTFSPDPPAHVKIEAALIDIGGGAKKGIEYKKLVLAAAGWKYKELTSFGAHAQTAANAFNNIRNVLAETDDSGAILDSLKKIANDES